MQPTWDEPGSRARSHRSGLWRHCQLLEADCTRRPFQRHYSAEGWAGGGNRHFFCTWKTSHFSAVFGCCRLWMMTPSTLAGQQASSNWPWAESSDLGLAPCKVGKVWSGVHIFFITANQIPNLTWIILHQLLLTAENTQMAFSLVFPCGSGYLFFCVWRA